MSSRRKRSRAEQIDWACFTIDGIISYTWMSLRSIVTKVLGPRPMNSTPLRPTAPRCAYLRLGVSPILCCSLCQPRLCRSLLDGRHGIVDTPTARLKHDGEERILQVDLQQQWERTGETDGKERKNERTRQMDDKSRKKDKTSPRGCCFGGAGVCWTTGLLDWDLSIICHAMADIILLRSFSILLYYSTRITL